MSFPVSILIIFSKYPSYQHIQGLRNVLRLYGENKQKDHLSDYSYNYLKHIGMSDEQINKHIAVLTE